MNDTTTAQPEPVTAEQPPTAIDLCDGKRVTLAEAEAALANLGEGWRLPTPHEEFSAVDYDHKNANGALSQDESRTPDPYWTNQPYPLAPAARVVVWFGDGFVGGLLYVGSRARARAVRVAGQ